MLRLGRRDAESGTRTGIPGIRTGIPGTHSTVLNATSRSGPFNILFESIGFTDSASAVLQLAAICTVLAVV